ncbi:AraC family transcriptional regulator [Asanoa sp. WMMD1127]|uniref:AraC family transcriptional regulator n=1 Tax=Asanoa sp. WMMD1127 TaxID=3016107 RepID=UPI00241637E7|nr:AraC family transcriptional regulator [Asanoa sp. WMMD1127]MDG4827392.1 AraC family transcriptional regulator [Asanoa sp. WMMD1127]
MRHRPDTERVDTLPPETHSFRIADLDQARACIAEFYYDVVLDPLDRTRPLALAADMVRLGPVTVGDIRFGVDVAIGADVLDAYHVNLPLTGAIGSEHRGAVTVASPRRAAVYRAGAGAHTGLWSADCRTLGIRLDRAALEAELAGLLGRPVRGPIRFGASFDTTRGAGLTWARMVNLLRSEIVNPQSALLQPLVAERYAHSLLDGLLLAVEHQHTEALTAHAPPVRPRTVRRAIQVMEADPTHPFTTAELARIAGVSARSLQEGFRRHVGVSPMTYLQNVRMAYAREELRDPPPGRDTVAAIAHAWGFGHLGRFAATYRERFGESPSATLRGR